MLKKKIKKLVKFKRNLIVLGNKIIEILKNNQLVPFDLSNKKQAFSLALLGVVIALVFGGLVNIFGFGNWVYWLLLVVGIIVGIGNIFHEEGVLFLVAGLTLTLVLNLLAGAALFPAWIVTLFTAVVYVLSPVMVIVSLKVFYALALE